MIAVHRRDLPRATSRRCGGDSQMPYRGVVVSIDEMLNILIGSGRTEADAGIELGHALEDKKIFLFAPDGSGPDGPFWRKISDEETSAIITFLHDLCNRARISTIGSYNAPIALFKVARAIRMQFETECDLLDAELPSEAKVPMERKDAVRACIERGMIPASTTTWNAFCEQVRDLANGWIDKKEGTTKRGFDEKTIKRDVKETMN